MRKLQSFIACGFLFLAMTLSKSTALAAVEAPAIQLKETGEKNIYEVIITDWDQSAYAVETQFAVNGKVDKAQFQFDGVSESDFTYDKKESKEGNTTFSIYLSKLSPISEGNTVTLGTLRISSGETLSPEPGSGYLKLVDADYRENEQKNASVTLVKNSDGGNTPGDEGGNDKPGGGEGGNDTPGGDNGGGNTPGGDNGGSNTPGGDNGGSNTPGGDNGGSNTPGGDNGGSNTPEGDNGGSNTPGGDNGGSNTPGGDNGGSNPSDGVSAVPVNQTSSNKKQDQKNSGSSKQTENSQEASTETKPDADKETKQPESESQAGQESKASGESMDSTEAAGQQDESLQANAAASKDAEVQNKSGGKVWPFVAAGVAVAGVAGIGAGVFLYRKKK